MRASRSRKKFRIHVFQGGGMIWRTGALARFESAQGAQTAPASLLLGCCGKPKALLRRLGDSAAVLSERGRETNDKPMVRLVISSDRPNPAATLLQRRARPLSRPAPAPQGGVQAKVNIM